MNQLRKYFFPGTKYLSMGPITMVIDEGVKWYYSTLVVESGPRWKREQKAHSIVRRGDGCWWDLLTTEDFPREPLGALEMQVRAKHALAQSGKGFFDEQ